MAGLIAGAAARRRWRRWPPPGSSTAYARRLDSATATTLPAYAEAIALVLAALSVLLPPVGLVGVVMAVVLLRGGKRRDGEKYAGLRILR